MKQTKSEHSQAKDQSAAVSTLPKSTNAETSTALVALQTATPRPEVTDLSMVPRPMPSPFMMPRSASNLSMVPQPTKKQSKKKRKVVKVLNEPPVANGNAPPKRSRPTTVTQATVQPVTAALPLAVLPLPGEDVPCSLEDANATPLPKCKSKQHQSLELLSTKKHPRDSHGIMQANPEGMFLDNPTNLASEHDGTLFLNELSQLNPDNRKEFQLDPPVFCWMKEKNLVKKCPRDVIYETRDTEHTSFNPNQPKNEHVRLCQDEGYVPIDGSKVGCAQDNRGRVCHGVTCYAHVDGCLMSSSRDWIRTTGEARKVMTSGTGDILAHRSNKIKTGCQHSHLVRTYPILSCPVQKSSGHRLAGLHDESATGKMHTVCSGFVILGTWCGPRPLGYIQQHDDRKDDDSLTNLHWLPREWNNTTACKQPG